uniref:Uncharacterized protein n=1 Tax=Glossina brevipalpis TaxID=37001 RepID=A0A1A9W0M1_9MUSC
MTKLIYPLAMVASLMYLCMMLHFVEIVHMVQIETDLSLFLQQPHTAKQTDSLTDMHENFKSIAFFSSIKIIEISKIRKKAFPCHSTLNVTKAVTYNRACNQTTGLTNSTKLGTVTEHYFRRPAFRSAKIKTSARDDLNFRIRSAILRRAGHKRLEVAHTNTRKRRKQRIAKAILKDDTKKQLLCYASMLMSIDLNFCVYSNVNAPLKQTDIQIELFTGILPDDIIFN